MKPSRSKLIRVLAIAPSSRGFGFAVVEGFGMLVDWGVKSVKGDKNSECLDRIARMIDLYRPDLLALQDHGAKGSRRAPRIQNLGGKIQKLAVERKIAVRLIPETRLKKAMLQNGRGTRHDVAVALANRFPDELGASLPPKRRLWMSEDYRMDIFAAVALALMAIQRGGSPSADGSA